MAVKAYLNKKYTTPQSLTNKYHGSTALIIGTGTSTADMVGYKSLIKKKFDLVIGLNHATKNFEEDLTFRLIVEKKPDGFLADLDGRKYRKNLPHIINWKSIDRYPKNIPLIKTTRSNFDFSPNIRRYKHNDNEGLLKGPVDSKGLSAGSVACQALHLACICGADEIYMIGCDLLFKAGGDHYYGGNYYANSVTKPANRSPIIEVDFEGRPHKTTEFFLHSAKFIDYVIETYCKKENIKVYDFSHGLISKAVNLDLDDFFGDGK